MEYKNENRSLGSVLEELKDGILKVNDEYQRKYVWKGKEIKSELMRSVLNNYPIGTILVESFPITDEYLFGKNEIIDGQQRLKTLLHFKNGEIKMSGKSVKKFINYNLHILQKHKLEDKKAKIILDNWENKIKFSISYKNLPDFFKKRFNKYQINMISLSNAKENEIRDYFKSVQNQEKLKAGEILSAMPDSVLDNIFTNNDYDMISKKLNLNDNRKDLLKNLNMIVCLKNNLIRMGVVDKEIIKYTEKLTDKNLENGIKEALFNLKESANKTKQKEYKNKFKIGALKLFILTYFDPWFEEYNFSQRREIINKISYEIGFFNSKDVNKKNRINEFIRGSIHNLWQLLKTTHKNDAVNKTIEVDLRKVFGYYGK